MTSNGAAVSDIDELANALATFATDAARSARQADLVASSVSVFMETHRFSDAPHHAPSRAEPLSPATANTVHIVRAALAALRQIHREGVAYKRAGVMLRGLVDKDRVPASLFDTHDPKDDSLIEAFDRINDRLGPGSIRLGAAAYAASWGSGSAFRSPCYTTNWAEIPKVRT